ncbi:MAG TPA: transcriptional regulator [Chloroflexota bacterium]|nr:transcriptional regulator [Chloroflexota bacterium]
MIPPLLLPRRLGRHRDAVVELTKLREARGATQRRIADAWEVTQANISQVEHTPDIFLSTLSKYVEALGGHLEIRAVFPDRVTRLLPTGASSRNVRDH